MQKEKKVNKKEQVKKEKTLLQHIESIIEWAQDSKLENDFYKKAKKSISFVAKEMELSENQSILFSIFIELSDDERVQLSDISKFIGCRNIKTISLINDIEELEKRRFIRCRKDRNNGKCSYRVPIEVVNAVKQSKVFKIDKRQYLTSQELFKEIDRLFNERENEEISSHSLLEELCSLFDDNPSLSFCKEMKKMEVFLQNRENYLILLLFCHRFINLDDDEIGFHDFDDLFEDKWLFKKIKTGFQKGNHSLFENKILENCNDNGFKEANYFRITSEMKEAFFSEMDIQIVKKEKSKELISHEKISAKQLFYNENEQLQISQFSTLLQEEQFNSVIKRLEENGMRKGFACLFHGAPGTGKTETVYQLARETGRDIFMVDMAQTKSMWFGESEKIVKEIFVRYKKYCQNCNKYPILLFNEADAIIGKRKEIGGNSSIDQTENTIQNIILQEMENLEGIMIATTNLTQNLDKAFERRFLYKIEFQKPELPAKIAIWRSMMAELSEEEAEILSKRFDFSGGEIENIIRKNTVNQIIHGERTSFENILNDCQSEKIVNTKLSSSIGFTVNRD